MPSEDSDPIEYFQLTLEVAKFQASEKRFYDAYLTLAAAYENLIEQHDEAINEIIELRKKLSGI
jgi:hypothetical protein